MNEIPIQIHPELRKWQYIDTSHMITVQIPHFVRRIYRQCTLSRPTLNSCKIAFGISCVEYIGIQKKEKNCKVFQYISWVILVVLAISAHCQRIQD